MMRIMELGSARGKSLPDASEPMVRLTVPGPTCVAVASYLHSTDCMWSAEGLQCHRSDVTFPRVLPRDLIDQWIYDFRRANRPRPSG